MCFGGGSSSTPTPKQTYATRFEYNQPVPKPGDQQREQVQQAQAEPAQQFGSELGGGYTGYGGGEP